MDVNREAIVSTLDASTPVDIAIIGGGIHGAALARRASTVGLNVVLLERDDYASGTSSRSSKMAHGGLRYLEMGDFQQVFEGIKAREALFEAVPHLVRPCPFLIPVPRGHWFFRMKLGIGLHLYDLMVQKRERRHRWIPRRKLDFPVFNANRSDLDGCYLYTDGILSDARLVIESVYGALRAGARCLNYAEVVRVGDLRDGSVALDWRDRRTDREHTLKARLVVNCAGPWAPLISHSSVSPTSHPVRYSRGTHLLFSKPWNGPALFLPLEDKARYYFVWPHFAGTMVGTTEREVQDLEDDPQPTHDEVEEILSRVRHDLPGSGLDEKTLHYAFAGVRTLPLRSNNKETARLSRKHSWTVSNGMLTLLGGKFTTAEWTAAEGLKKIIQILGRTIELSEPQRSWQDDERVSAWRNELAQSGVSETLIQNVIRRYGSRAPEVVTLGESSEPLGAHTLKSEVRYAIEIEQAETLEDIMRRRLELEYMAGAGLDVLDQVLEVLSQCRPGSDIDLQRRRYLERITAIQKLLDHHGASTLSDRNLQNGEGLAEGT